MKYVQMGMYRYPLARMVNIITNDNRNNAKNHQRGTSLYDRIKTLSWSVYCSLILLPDFHRALNLSKVVLRRANPNKAIHIMTEV